MKIAILSYTNTQDNYGQLLQNYAVYKYFENSGNDVSFIKYDFQNEKRKKTFRNLIVFIIKLLRKNKHNNELFVDRKFDEFRKKMKYYPKTFKSYNQLKKEKMDFDAYVVGSDQVWNFTNLLKIKPNIIRTFMLDFVPKNKMKISFSPSFGIFSPNKKEAKYLIKRLQSFDLVTVREQKGLEILSKLGLSTPKWTCDPTLSLPKSCYLELINESGIVPSSKYLFLYYVENGGEFDLQRVYNFARERCLEVIHVSANSNKHNSNFDMTYPTIQEWLSLIQNAQYVITNSFHCCVFSLIFEKKFGVITINGKNKGMNSRIDSLFKITNVTPRVLSNEDFSSLDNPVESIYINNENNFSSYFK